MTNELKIDAATATAIWSAKNNAGEGYAVGADNDEINDLDIGELLYAAQNDQEVAVYRDSDGLIAVGDVYGPWAVRIEAR